MTDGLSPSDYKELKDHIQSKDTVQDIRLTRRSIDHKTRTDLYLGFTCTAAGIDLWSLHDDFDVDVVFSWHDPLKDRLDMGLRLRE